MDLAEIPAESGHRFRLIPATFLRFPESESTLDNFEEIGQNGRWTPLVGQN